MRPRLPLSGLAVSTRRTSVEGVNNRITIGGLIRETRGYRSAKTISK